ncbi:hypothetical protein EUGRSUZ_K00506 [Eucalyptus grandis]|uniref:Uncharacterized protein n=2 Tax=Eucalyptus grandis TaxID=71139 RepID=A0ACC3IRV5_EUCGR|nr:hypothetical protein EUGRSUZ_K00506 [Eucalyptus grandis]
MVLMGPTLCWCLRVRWMRRVEPVWEEVVFLYVLPINDDLSFHRIVEPQQKGQNRGLSGTTWPDKSHLRPSFNSQREVLENGNFWS